MCIWRSAAVGFGSWSICASALLCNIYVHALSSQLCLHTTAGIEYGKLLSSLTILNIDMNISPDKLCFWSGFKVTLL